MKEYEENMKELLSPYMDRAWDLEKFRACRVSRGGGWVVAKYEFKIRR